jgi:hypothetical protein
LRGDAVAIKHDVNTTQSETAAEIIVQAILLQLSLMQSSIFWYHGTSSIPRSSLLLFVFDFGSVRSKKVGPLLMKPNFGKWRPIERTSVNI